MRHTRPLLIGLAAGALLLTGCTAQPAAESGGSEEVAEGFLAVADDSIESSGTFRAYLDYDTVEPNGLDPRSADTARSWTIMGLSYETLVNIDENFEFTPGLAESWEEVSPTEYVFQLRDDAVFSNGRPMTPEDVTGSIELLLESQSAWSAQLGPVASADVTGEHEVTITLSSPYTALLGALANTPAGILPVQEVRDGTVDLTTEMVGTGPFVATEHVQDESWTFEQNPHYPGLDELGIDTIELEIVPDEANRLAAIRDGSAQYAFFNNADALDLLAGTPNATAVNQQNTDFYYVILNSTDPDSPLADPKVRQAVNAAIDRAQLSDLALAGHGLPTGVTPVSLPGACNPDDLPSAQMTDEEITAAFEEAGGDLELSLVTWNSESAPGQIAQILQQQLEPFGVTVDIEIVDDATYGAAFFNGGPATADIGVSWFAGYGDAAMVSRWWNTDVTAFTAGFMTGNPEVNALVVDASEEPAGASRDAILTDLCAAVDEQAEMVPLMTRPGVIAYRTDLVSPTINANEGYGDIFRYLTDFRLIGAE
ncbi:ABC transporter substrate-binding protein [Agromyces silvae]|uniref:ABC transporter substrate-binding protein n=1 Tax=Agromyces silvae TaxID=3388266 RepID=UPI00280AB0D1|nr:ABC transporter substrate-binding protein [Agromyces protaetiae]